jgi:hypothetical protein
MGLSISYVFKKPKKNHPPFERVVFCEIIVQEVAAIPRAPEAADRYTYTLHRCLHKLLVGSENS